MYQLRHIPFPFPTTTFRAEPEPRNSRKGNGEGAAAAAAAAAGHGVDTEASRGSPSGAAAEDGGQGEVCGAVSAGGSESRESMEEDDGEEELEVSLAMSLFDNHLEADIESALAHMGRFGFYLPDVQYVSDLEGLMQYLHEKVRIGKMCLYCQRTFRSAQACRQHMIDKGHCKIRYDDEEDMDEFVDFYDYSSSYGYSAMEREEDSGSDAEDGEGDEELLQPSDGSRRMPRVEVLPSGELLLTRNGKTSRLGVRWLRRYYKQNARVIEERESVLAAQRERLLLMYQRAGVPTSSPLVQERIRTDMLALSNREGSRAISTHVQRAAQPRFVGAELKAARQHFRAFHNRRMKDGMNQNWLMKNKVAGKNRGEGTGVHG
mmetsp:Transcript_4214/g.12485  ORF Transcript_4214/g.12485 Transcript_4214/m.12485 type:complete len:376 (-) Transcript_4214:159-1286(-)